MIVNKLPISRGGGKIIVEAETSVEQCEKYRDLYGADVNYIKEFNFGDGCIVELDGEIHLLYYRSHYKWNGNALELVSAIPFDFTNGAALVLNGEIHTFGANASGLGEYQTRHYKWNGTSWTQVSTIPYYFYDGTAAVYNDEIHLLGGGNNDSGGYHYKWTGVSSGWTKVGYLPFKFCDGSTVVFNNEIHILGSTSSSDYTKHYKWNGSTWTMASTLPISFMRGAAVVYNNEIHILSGRKHCKWDGSTWAIEENIALGSLDTKAIVWNGELWVLKGRYYSGFNNGRFAGTPLIPDYAQSSDDIENSRLLTVNGELHFLGGAIQKNHYKWNGSAWVKASTLPQIYQRSAAVELNGELHFLGGAGDPNGHYKFSDNEWVKVSTIPYQFTYGDAVALNGEIHILGRGQSERNHYKWNGSTWESVSTIPYEFYRGGAVVLNSEIHILGGQSSSARHYKWNGKEWIQVSTLPFNINHSIGKVITNDGKIYLFGLSDKCYIYDTAWTERKITFSQISNPYFVADYKGNICLTNTIGDTLLYYPEKKKIRINVKKGFAVYTNCEFHSDIVDGNIVTKDAVIEFTAYGYYYLTILNKKDISCFLTEGYWIENKKKGYFLKGMKVNGQTINNDGLQEIETDQPLYIEC